MRPYRRKMHRSWRRRSSGFFARIYDYVLPFACHLYYFWCYERPLHNLLTKLMVTVFCVVMLILPLLYLLFVPLVTLSAFQHILMGLEGIPPYGIATSTPAVASVTNESIKPYVLPFSPAAMGLPPQKDMISAFGELLKLNMSKSEKRMVAYAFKEKLDSFCIQLSILIITQEYIMATRNMITHRLEMQDDELDEEVLDD